MLAGILLAALVLFGYVFQWIQYTFPSKNFHSDLGLTADQLKVALYPINFVKNALTGVAILGSILALVLGALAVGSEFGWGTIKTIYTQRPSCLQAFAGQVGAVSMIVAVLVVAFYVLAALCSWAVIAIDGKPAAWPAAIDILKALGATWLIFECWTLFGMALAFLFRQSAMAIGLGLAYVLAIEGILFRALSGFNLSWLMTVEKFFVGQNANALTGSFGTAIASRARWRRPCRRSRRCWCWPPTPSPSSWRWRRSSEPETSPSAPLPLASFPPPVWEGQGGGTGEARPRSVSAWAQGGTMRVRSS